MSIRALAVVSVVLLSTSCEQLRLPHWGAPATVGGRPVALLLEGSAFDPSARAAAARGLEGELGRPVRVIEALSAPADDETKALAARTVGARGLRYDWREPQCAWDRALLAGVTHDVDAVYRVALERVEHARPATDEEWEQLGVSRFGFRRLRERPTIREELLTGSVARTAIVLKDAVARAAIQRRAVTLATDEERIDVGAALAEAVRGLGPEPAPDWDGVARRLVRQGCPFLALAIADTQAAADARGSLQTAALQAMRTSQDRGAARGRAQDRRNAPTPREPGDAAATAQAAAAADAAPEAPGVSCHALCEMHMVEICNSDKVLWSAHRTRWEPTPCGTRRGEPFLAQCYQEQWDTGTFETSCVQPCEESEAGRSRLTAIMRDAGCVAGPGPT